MEIKEGGHGLARFRIQHVPDFSAWKAKIVAYFDYIHCLLDSLGICSLAINWTTTEGISPSKLAQFYSFATGIKTSEKRLMKIGERIHNVEKMFNVYHVGFSRKDDYPPQRLMKKLVRSRPSKGELLKKRNLDKMLDEYHLYNDTYEESGKVASLCFR